MSARAALYTILITAGLLAGATAIAALYYSGSASIPGWRASFTPGPLSFRHSFLNESCESCHTPVRGVEAVTCISCHATAMATLAKQSTAFHSTAQACSGCHIEHDGAARPIRMDHTVLLKIGLSSTGNSPARQSVSRQLVDDVAGYLGRPASAAAEKELLNCASCHSNEDPHQQLFGRECAECHATSTWQIASFLHPSAESRDCAQCHQAPPSHYMGHFHMVSKMVAGQMHARVDQCYLCHKTNSFNDIKGVGWYKHH